MHNVSSIRWARTHMIYAYLDIHIYTYTYIPLHRVVRAVSNAADITTTVGKILCSLSLSLSLYIYIYIMCIPLIHTCIIHTHIHTLASSSLGCQQCCRHNDDCGENPLLSLSLSIHIYIYIYNVHAFNTHIHHTYTHTHLGIE